MEEQMEGSRERNLHSIVGSGVYYSNLNHVTWGWEWGSSVCRGLVEDLRSDTHHPNKNLGVMVSIIPALRRERWVDLWSLPASLAESGGLWVQGETLSQKTR